MHTELVRTEVERLLAQRTFQPFALSLENGDRLTIDHPENIAFEPGTNGHGGSRHFYVISRGLMFYGLFEAVSSVALIDRGDQPAGT